MDPVTLMVYGTTNLRIVDASLMPMLIAAHLQRTVYAIAERVRDRLGTRVRLVRASCLLSMNKGSLRLGNVESEEEREECRRRRLSALFDLAPDAITFPSPALARITQNFHLRSSSSESLCPSSLLFVPFLQSTTWGSRSH